MNTIPIEGLKLELDTTGYSAQGARMNTIPIEGLKHALHPAPGARFSARMNTIPIEGLKQLTDYYDLKIGARE